MKTMQRYAVVAVVLGFVLGGCGGGAGQANDTQLTAAVGASAKEASPELEQTQAVTSFLNLLNQLVAVPQLAPLFDLYQLKAPIVMQDDEESSGLIALLHAVKITTSGGAVTITNRQTGGVIFTAPRSDLGSGTFSAQNLPGGTPPPAATCTAFTYSPWGVCQPDGTQARTVTASTPAGCTGGTPGPLTQPCTTTPPPPATCTGFTYSTWGACQPNGTQTRTVLSSTPSGCTGGNAGPLTQTCTYTPPVTTCTAFTYSAWGACGANGTQTRTVTSSTPSGCTGGTPGPLTQTCTPPPATCTAFTYSAWSACGANGTQTRTVTSSTPSGCTGGTPGPLTQTCTPPPVTCTAFTYSAWGACQSNGTQSRTVTSSTPSGCTGGTPGPLTQTCTPPIDGAALYGQYCAGCHGALASSNLKGKSISLTLIKQFNMTQGLTDAQLQAIVTAVGP